MPIKVASVCRIIMSIQICFTQRTSENQITAAECELIIIFNVIPEFHLYERSSKFL